MPVSCVCALRIVSQDKSFALHKYSFFSFFFFFFCIFCFCFCLFVIIIKITNKNKLAIQAGVRRLCANCKLFQPSSLVYASAVVSAMTSMDCRGWEVVYNMQFSVPSVTRTLPRPPMCTAVTPLRSHTHTHAR